MQNFHHTNDCPIRDILTRIGEKWPMLVLVTLHANGTMRFSDIQRRYFTTDADRHTAQSRNRRTGIQKSLSGSAPTGRI